MNNFLNFIHSSIKARDKEMNSERYTSTRSFLLLPVHERAGIIFMMDTGGVISGTSDGYQESLGRRHYLSMLLDSYPRSR